MTTNLLHRVKQELDSLYLEANDFNELYSINDLMSIFARDNCPVVRGDSATIFSFKTNQQLFNNALIFAEFLVAIGDFECGYIVESKNKKIEHVSVDFKEFKNRILQQVSLYGYAAREVIYFFELYPSMTKGRLVPPEIIPYHIIILFK